MVARFLYKPIDEVRKELIGLKIVDIEPKGAVIHLQDKEGRRYTIDNTGENGAVVHAYATESERLNELEQMFEALLEKLGIEENDLWELIYG